MTVEVERAFDVDAPIETVWELLSDDETRAQTISVVESYDLRGHGDHQAVIWQLSLPIPLVSSTISVRTRDVERDAPSYVKFIGQSKVMTVTGEHELTETDDGGCHVVNRFIVDGKVPGVEKFFKRNIDGEIDNFQRVIRDHIRDIEEA
jgi:carbon monoxide dehydrogenase subunit G